MAVGWNSTTNVYFGLVDFNNEVNSLRVYYEAKSGRISELSDISYTSLPTVTISSTLIYFVHPCDVCFLFLSTFSQTL